MLFHVVHASFVLFKKKKNTFFFSPFFCEAYWIAFVYGSLCMQIKLPCLETQPLAFKCTCTVYTSTHPSTHPSIHPSTLCLWAYPDRTTTPAGPSYSAQPRHSSAGLLALPSDLQACVRPPWPLPLGPAGQNNHPCASGYSSAQPRHSSAGLLTGGVIFWVLIYCQYNHNR